MKQVIKLEEAGLLLLIVLAYAFYFPGHWGLFAAWFFVPDLSFIFFAASRKWGAILYNIIHHRGFIALLWIAGIYLDREGLTQTAIIFMAHSTFDRILGYGLKYPEDIERTHLGYIGKSAYKNS